MLHRPFLPFRQAAAVAPTWRRRWRALALAACAAALAACTMPPTAGGGQTNTAIGDPPLTNATMAERIENETMAQLRGTAMLRKGVAVPAGAEFEAVLLNPSRPELFSRALFGSQKRVLGRDIVEAPDDRIVAFMIPYDTSTIDPNQVYTVRATISSGGQVLYQADQSVKVRTGRAGTTLDNALVMVRVQPAR